ncbi:COG3650 family protein [Paracoccus beibuensis]|uniref:COG3650 family protein n=1 Tax=Paracoccus beibuensis TaxID=547602 RepID=UPI00223EDC5F|nr:SH3 domain-containing protein [Paracoccus beibuensis]
MLRTALALTLVLAGPAAATQEYTLPTLFDVTDVAADDVLNIRAEPSASAKIIGTLAPDATHVEVVEERRGWARVNTAERSGWVSSRFLNYRVDVWEEGALPQGFRCFGTEPFWSLAAKGGSVTLARPGEDDVVQPATALSTGIFRLPTRAVVAGDMTLTATPQICTDGMSDRLYGLQALLVLRGQTPELMSGCCSIQP